MDLSTGPQLDVDQFDGFHIGEDRRISLYLDAASRPFAIRFSPEQCGELFEQLLSAMDELAQRFGPVTAPVEIMPTAMTIGLPEEGDSVIVNLEHRALHFPVALSRTAALALAIQVQRRILEATAPGASGPQ